MSHVHTNTKICHFIINPTTVDFKTLILKSLHQQTYKGFCVGEVGLHIVCKEIQCREFNRGGVCPYKNNAQNKWSSMLGSVHTSSLSLPSLPSTIALNIERVILHVLLYYVDRCWGELHFFGVFFLVREIRDQRGLGYLETCSKPWKWTKQSGTKWTDNWELWQLEQVLC